MSDVWPQVGPRTVGARLSVTHMVMGGAGGGAGLADDGLTRDGGSHIHAVGGHDRKCGVTVKNWGALIRARP